VHNKQPKEKQMKKHILTLAVLALTGCATIFNSSPRSVHVHGTAKAPLTLTKDGIPMQNNISLPMSIYVPNGWSSYALKNQNGMCPIGSTVNGATFLNILFGGLIGVGIDLATGDIIRAKSEAVCNI